MVFRCKKKDVKTCRFRMTKKGVVQRLCGCKEKGKRKIKFKEVTTFRNGKVSRRI